MDTAQPIAAKARLRSPAAPQWGERGQLAHPHSASQADARPAVVRCRTWITGLAAYLPGRILTTAQLAEATGRPISWFTARTGIDQRRPAGPDETAETVAVAAVRTLARATAFPVSKCDLVIGATYTPSDTVATLAHQVQRAFVVENLRVFRVSAACTSVLVTMEVAQAFLQCGRAKTALVAAAVHNSLYADDADEQAGRLWGDAAAAFMLSATPSQTSGYEIIDVATSGLAHIGQGPEGIFLNPKSGVNRIETTAADDRWLDSIRSDGSIAEEFVTFRKFSETFRGLPCADGMDRCCRSLAIGPHDDSKDPARDHGYQSAKDDAMDMCQPVANRYAALISRVREAGKRLSSTAANFARVVAAVAVFCAAMLPGRAFAEPNLLQVSMGTDHACLVRGDGSLSCWGGNSDGQGDAPAGQYLQVSGGNYFSCAVRSDDQLVCWGANHYGIADVPQGVFAQVSAGATAACAIALDGSLRCWGGYLNGFEHPIESPPTGGFSQVSTGWNQACAIGAGGALSCWGIGFEGQPPAAPGGSFIAISIGTHHACGIHADGHLECWGRNDQGESSPPPGVFSGVEVGHQHTCASRADGTITCWGDNAVGQLEGIPAGPLVQFEVGAHDACGIRPNDTLVCWGNVRPASPRPAIIPDTLPNGLVGTGYAQQLQLADPNTSYFPALAAFVLGEGVLPGGLDLNAAGRLDGTPTISGNFGFTVEAEDQNGFTAQRAYTLTIASPVPVDSAAPQTTITDGPADPTQAIGGAFLFTGDDGGGSGIASFACSLDAAPFAPCTSPFAFAGLATGLHGFAVRAIDAAGNIDPTPATASWTITTSGGVAPAVIDKISAGVGHNCVVRADDSVSCWGFNGDGQTQAPAGSFLQVSAANSHSCGLRSDHTIECWGANGQSSIDMGQADVPEGAYLQVSAGFASTCAIRLDNTLLCWGNGWGQYVPSGGTFTQVSLALTNGFNCGLRGDGTLACWSGMSSQYPVPAGTFSHVDGGPDHACAVRTDGSVVCWGSNTSGQASPPPGDFVEVGAGQYHSCGRRTDGTLACWGGDPTQDYGQYTPPAGSFVSLAVGTHHNCALRADGAVSCWGWNGAGGSPNLAVMPATLPVGIVGSTYAQQLTLVDVPASETYSPYAPVTPAFALVEGALPPGLVLGASGDLGGVPTTPGTYVFTIEGEDANTFFASREYTLVISTATPTDTEAPDTTIDNHPADPTNQTGAAFEFSGSDAGGSGLAGFECSLDGAPFEACTSPQSYAGLVTGAHAFAVRSVDVAGNRDATPAEFAWTITPGLSLPAVGRGSVAVGISDACEVHPDGHMSCWGLNENGQSNPPAGSFVRASLGRVHACALRDTGAIACWGTNSQGRITPPAGTNFVQVSASDENNCALRSDGTLACWGSSEFGQGAPPPGSYSSLDMGRLHGCGVRSDGAVACWGIDGDGQSTPPVGNFVQVSAGNDFSCGLRADGTVQCWGANNLGQRNAPGGTFVQIASGWYHTCGRRPDGSLACWGSNQDGQATPPQGSFVQMDANHLQACGLRSDDVLVCWGQNNFGKAPRLALQPATLASGDVGSPLSVAFSLVDTSTYVPPTPAFALIDGTLPAGLVLSASGVLSGTPTVAGNFAFTIEGEDANRFVASRQYTMAIAAPLVVPPPRLSGGNLHTCRLRVDGTVGCWGWNAFGQTQPPAGEFTSVTSGQAHSCALGADGSLACWGDNEYGQTVVPAGAYLAASAGSLFTCAIRSDGALACWGRSVANRTTPPAGNFVALDSGSSHSCAIRTDGTLACWGSNDFGQATPPAGVFSAISAGENFSCGVRGDSSLACWGLATQPVTPPGGTFRSVAVATNHGCALRQDGTVTCWGIDSHGSITPPAGLFDAVTVGQEHSCATKVDGTIACWGNEFFGAAPQLVIAPATMPSATLSTPFSQQLLLADVGNGGSTTYPYVAPTPAFALVDGGLPQGMQLSSTGAITGTPTVAGTFAFTVDAEDANGFTATHSYSLLAAVSNDATPPVIAPVVSSTLGLAGWYVGDVTLQWSVSDAESTITSSNNCATLVQNIDTSGSTFTCTATSSGGTASASITIRRDATPPTLSPTVTPVEVPLNGSSVAAANASDALSGLASQSCTPTDTSTVGAKTSTCTASDVAGNTATATAAYTVLDGSAPQVTPTITGALGNDGWYVGNVTVTWTTHDPDGPILAANGCSSATLAVDSASITYTCAATSAGGTTSESVTVKRDATPPTLSPVVTPASIPLGGTGTLVANAADAMSGIASQSCTPVDTSTLGPRTSSCTATDVAGNSASASAPYQVVDATAPVVVANVTGTLGTNGWYVSNVSVTWSVTDPEGPITSRTGCATQSVTTDTAGVTFTCVATSAGGTTTRSVEIKRDTRKPEVPLYSYVTVFLNSTAPLQTGSYDALSGVASQVCPAIVTTSVGKRTVNCTSIDRAGNSATLTITYVVVYRFSGFSAPLLNHNSTYYAIPVNKLIPMRWRITDVNSNPVTNLTAVAVALANIDCLGRTPVTLSEYGKGATALKNLGNGYYEMNVSSNSPYQCTAIGLKMGATSADAFQYGWVRFRRP